LGLIALAAPIVATDLAWVARSDDHGWSSPALRSVLGRRVLSSAAFERPVLNAPIPYDPEQIDLERVFAAPSRGHWLGTDGLGRDVASRVVHGGQTSLGVGLLAALLALGVGLPLGAVAGYRGGLADAVVSRAVEAVLCFPALLLVLAVLAMEPHWLAAVPDVARIAIVLGLTGWIPVTRYLRGEFLRIRGSDMVAAARASGATHLRLVIRHILPSSLAPVLVTAAFAVGAAVLLEAALSFIGLGVRPPTPTWGGMLAEARVQVSRCWWLALFPGAALFLAVLGCNLLGEGIRDRLDPRSRAE
jgi:peptide/nickel transport system permease protein